MVTAVAAPEVNWKPVYGVVWGGHQHPLSDYDDLGEARAVAQACGGTVLVRWEARTDWGLL